MPVSRSANDPSNPNAPEGAMTVAHVHAHGAPNDGVSPVLDGRGSGDVTYVCPMHPDVTSHEPGVCPKCNMKLVPKK